MLKCCLHVTPYETTLIMIVPAVGLKTSWLLNCCRSINGQDRTSHLSKVLKYKELMQWLFPVSCCPAYSAYWILQWLVLQISTVSFGRNKRFLLLFVHNVVGIVFITFSNLLPNTRTGRSALFSLKCFNSIDHIALSCLCIPFTRNCRIDLRPLETFYCSAPTPVYYGRWYFYNTTSFMVNHSSTGSS